MKYIYYIILIVSLVTAVVGYQITAGKSSRPEKDAALIINKKIVSTDEFKRLYASGSTQISSKTDFINALIMKELMIQEAQQEGIDKNEDFRLSIQNFYEQSLIKLLMDRKFAKLPVEVSDRDIERYRDLQTKQLHLTISSATDEVAAAAGRFLEKETKIVCYQDLSEDMREKVFALTEGESTSPFRAGKAYLVVRLDKTELRQDNMSATLNKETVRLILTQQRKKQAIEQWMTDLRAKATIRNLVKED